jgi:hypothetical protein
MVLFSFPEDSRWDPVLDAVAFGVEIGEYRGVVRVRREVFRRLLGHRPTPEQCVEAYHLCRTALEQAAEAKLRRRELAEDGNLDLTGRDLARAGSGEPG